MSRREIAGGARRRGAARGAAGVLLVHAPGAAPLMPSLACGLLQAVLAAESIPVETLDANLAAWAYAFPRGPVPPDILEPVPWDRATLHRICAGVPWEAYRVVWFPVAAHPAGATPTPGGQAAAALEMARWIRERHPQVTILCSGTGCVGWTAEQPSEVHRVIPGDPEPAAVALAHTLREWGTASASGQSPAPADLAHLPVPQFDPFFAQARALGITGFRPVLPMETARGCCCGAATCPVCSAPGFGPYRVKEPDQVVRELMTLARRYRTTAFRAMDATLGPEVVERVLPALTQALDQAQDQQPGGARFSLTYDLAVAGGPVGRREARAMKRSGVVRVLLRGGQPGIDIAWIETLKSLDEVGVGVVWDPPAADELGPAAEFLHHLPPPRHDGGHRTLARWREAHGAASLVYSPGPGFVRIYDRREPAGGGTVITLVGLQAEVFRYCEEARPLADIQERFGHRAEPAQMQRFLDGLVERRLMLRTPAGSYLTLPTQRKLEEVVMSV